MTDFVKIATAQIYEHGTVLHNHPDNSAQLP